MMNRLICALLTVMLLICSGYAVAQEAPAAEAETSTNSNILIAYFTRLDNTDATLDEFIQGGGPYGGIGSSWEDRDVDAIASASIVVSGERVLGNTQAVAEMIQSIVGGDLFSIQTVDKYPVDYDPLIDQGGEELGEEARPALATTVENMAQYNVVFVGFPTWWYDVPMPIATFLESYDFTGKIVIPFATSAGSGFARSTARLRDMLPNAILVENGLHVDMDNVPEALSTVENWVSTLSLPE